MFVRLRKRWLVAASVVASLVVAGVALAYFTSTGSGTGTASVGSPSNWTVTPATATGGPLYPGSGSESIPYTVTNPSPGQQQLANTEAFVTSSNGNVTQGGTPVAGCLASWFTAVDSSPASLPSDLASGGTASGSVSLTMQDVASSQNACQGVSPDVSIQVPIDGAVTNYTGGINNPRAITAGPDGALWFTNAGNNSIGRISTGGTVTNYTGTNINHPDAITVGPDGALWFSNPGSSSIGRISTSGTVTNFTGTGVSGPYGITAGPDGALWFTNAGNNRSSRSSAISSRAPTRPPRPRLC